jgi:allophanate hydrolase
MLNDQPDAIFPVTRQLISAAAEVSAAQAFKDFYQLRTMQRRCADQMTGLDALCVPTIPTFVTRDQDALDPIGPNNLLGRYTNFVNLLDMAGIASPVTPRTDGLRGCVTLLGPAGSDSWLASAAAVLTDSMAVSPGVTGWSVGKANNHADPVSDALHRSPDTTVLTAPHEMAIAAVGAHMSGMPLNHELTGLNGRKICETSTARGYRLFELAGGPPPRPGLLRDDSGDSITVEVWALPMDRVGEFLAGIPSPLGLGTVHLVNNQSVTGFICEPAGLDGARDVTRFGGWRSYIQSLT